MTFLKKATLSSALLMVLATILAVPSNAFAQEDEKKAAVESSTGGKYTEHDASVKKASFYAAAICVAVAVFGAALAVSRIGTAAVGAVAENPKIAITVLMYIALAEGLSIIGLLVGYLILNS